VAERPTKTNYARGYGYVIDFSQYKMHERAMKTNRATFQFHCHDLIKEMLLKSMLWLLVVPTNNNELKLSAYCNFL
jgi:hypothetical protein